MPDSNGNVNWINEFYEEPKEILERVKSTIATISLNKPFNQDLAIKRLKELLEIKEKVHPVTLTALDYMNKKVILGETLVHADERYIEEIHRLLLGGPHFERQK
jgi:hypothetical protein